MSARSGDSFIRHGPQIRQRLESLELGDDVREALASDLRTMMELLDMDAAHVEHQRPLERGTY